MQDPYVHLGFYDAWRSVRERMLQMIDLCTGGDSDWHVYVTGHSLGGALATLCAYDVKRLTCASTRLTSPCPSPASTSLQPQTTWAVHCIMPPHTSLLE
jgi:alpha-beta hydrolase superfamily lysophospholipase